MDEENGATVSPSPSCENCRSLKEEVFELKKELKEIKNELKKTKKQLKKSEFQNESSSKYVDSLREQVSELHKKLDNEKKRNTGIKNNAEQKAEIPGLSSNSGPTDIMGMDIASAIREAAEQATTNNGFVYDETTGLYFDYNTNYYYDPNTRLYYDYQKGIYYTYDTESDTYHFYSQVDISITNTAASDKGIEEDNKGETEVDATGIKEDNKDEITEKGIKEEKRGETLKQEKEKKIEIVESGSEDGEIIDVDDDDEEEEEVKDEVKDEDDESEKDEKEYPPCIRAIVMESDKLSVGSLNIITCMGITFGRMEGSGNFLRISDVEVSKEHAKIHYDNDCNQYLLTDLGSQNGTFINGTRLSESKVASKPHQLCHGEQLKLGGTMFLLHIHPGLETCDDCEPGQVQAQLKAKEIEDEVQIISVGKCSSRSNALMKKELRRLKKRYLLQNSDHEVNSEIASNTDGKYKDRAQVRRKKVGSDVPINKPDDAPSSVLKPINSNNKGRVMLEKMGWSNGEGLGKKNSGRREPVMVPLRETGCGLGYGTLRTIDTVSNNSKTIIWKKAQERYNASEKDEPVDMFADG